MKYGQALYERSVPQWAPCTSPIPSSTHPHNPLLTPRTTDNIDYNELKSLIRTHTSPPTSSHSHSSVAPVVIPGQRDEAVSRFEAAFARELGAQHARVDLFVRSKADEFRRRLGELVLFLWGMGEGNWDKTMEMGIGEWTWDERVDLGLENGYWSRG